MTPHVKNMIGSRIATMTDKELRDSIRTDERQQKTWSPESKPYKALTDELAMLREERNWRVRLRRAPYAWEKPTYWIQEQAPAGNYFDSIGFHPDKTEQDALQDLREWRKTFPKRVCRLVRRTDVVVKG
jgi:hypothetical protein